MSCKFCSAEKTFVISADRMIHNQWSKQETLGFHISCINLGSSKVEICKNCLTTEVIELINKWFNGIPNNSDVPSLQEPDSNIEGPSS
jgi:hypothetical protein